VAANLGPGFSLVAAQGEAAWTIDWRAYGVEAIKALAWPLFSRPVNKCYYLRRLPAGRPWSASSRNAPPDCRCSVSVELATFAGAAHRLAGRRRDPRRLTSSMIFDSASQALFAELAKPPTGGLRHRGPAIGKGLADFAPCSSSR
jgi:hypothetical protein